ncbi:BhlA/UviB family holin-like peptide [Guptibacillus hwajinpoensis]|uniref:BhlA/UviB family holin-like peptide n=1 Tax=Guptibacillus hwajinpoensis TaxID=208199 RepID=UPI0037370061
MNLDPEIIKLIVTQGIFAVLFVWLFFDTRREAKEREEKLMTALDKSTDSYKGIVDSVDKLEEKINEHFTK